MAISAARAEEIAKHFQEYGEAVTLDKMRISRETLRRAVRNHKANTRNAAPPDTTFDDKNVILKRIAAQYSPAELRALADGSAIGPPHTHDHKIDFSGTSFRFCFMTDTHFGSVFFKEELYFKMLEEAEKQNVDAYFHAGDVTEGMSGRPGQIYELTHLGAHHQREYAIKLLRDIKKPLYVIDGNHDRWVAKSSGTLIVKDICDALPNAHFLGHDQGVIDIKKSKIMLWHGEDSSSYATSYRIQRLIEAFTGGGKPGLLMCGHTHKQGYFFDRNVHAISGGAVCTQSSWMRGKRLANHTGFHIVTLHINKDGQISRCQVEWFPGYI